MNPAGTAVGVQGFPLMTMVAAAILLIAASIVLHHTGAFSSLLDRVVGHGPEPENQTADAVSDDSSVRTSGIAGWPGFGPSFYGEELPEPDPNPLPDGSATT
jgi:hypothetical protein